MKTIRQHLESLPEPYRTDALFAAEQWGGYMKLTAKVEHLGLAIGNGFFWKRTLIGEQFWEDLADYVWGLWHDKVSIKCHAREKTAASQAILDEHRAHFKASTRAVLIELLKGKTLHKHSGISGNISSRVSDLIRENGVPIIKGRKEKNGKLLYFTYHIAPEHRAEIKKRFKL